MLEIASSMNLPKNGLLWQKLREGNQIKFSPSANRSTQLEDLINKMMDPAPEARPTIEEILLHPNLSTIMCAEQKLKVEDCFSQKSTQVLASRDDMILSSPAG